MAHEAPSSLLVASALAPLQPLASCPRIAGPRRRARPARPSDTLRQVGPQGKALSPAGTGPALREIRLAGNGAVSGTGDRQRGRGNLESRSGSSMKKSFALCEAFGLTPFPSPWIPSAREGLSAGTGRPGRGHSRPWRRGPPLPALRCAQRGAVQVSLRAAPRGEDLKEAGGRRPPASFRTSPLPRLDSLLGTLTRAGGGVGGGGRPRPFGMLPWRGREAARRVHQPQLVYGLMTRDARSRRSRARSRGRRWGGIGGFGGARVAHGWGPDRLARSPTGRQRPSAVGGGPRRSRSSSGSAARRSRLQPRGSRIGPFDSGGQPCAVAVRSGRSARRQDRAQ